MVVDMKKVLQINVVYGQGSTGKIVKVIHDNIDKRQFESYVLYGRGKNVKEKKVKKIVPEIICKFQALGSRITGYAYAGCWFSTNKLIKEIKKIQPDVIHLHCLNGYFVNIYKLLHFLRKNNIPTILTLHAEFMYTGGCGNTMGCKKWVAGCYDCEQIKQNSGRPKTMFLDRSNKEWNMMKEALEKFESIVVCPVSTWLEKQAEQSAAMQDKNIVVVLNSLDENIFCFRKDEYEQKHSNRKRVLYVTPDFESKLKGGEYIQELSKRMIEDVDFYVVGKYNSNNKQLKELENVIFLGEISEQHELACLYSISDVTILTSKSETFSMVCAESLCCGTPVIGFKAGGPESIALEEYSDFVEYGDVDALEQALKSNFVKQWDKTIISEMAICRFGKKRMLDSYSNLYRKLS